MFDQVKSMLPISGDGYDAEIILQIYAAALDLTRTAEIVLPGSIEISIDPVTKKVTDNSTVTDALIITTIATWCAARIGNPPNYDKLIGAYESMKGSLRISSEYTNYPDDQTEEDSDETSDDTPEETPEETPVTT